MTRRQAEAFAQFLANQDQRECLVVQDWSPDAPPAPRNFYWTTDRTIYKGATICARYGPRQPRRGQERRSPPQRAQGASGGDKASESPPAPSERGPYRPQVSSYLPDPLTDIAPETPAGDKRSPRNTPPDPFAEW